jgi:hypothetical protein
MVLHDHQANPHVHISVRAESKHGRRLNPRKADLHRWRETFAAKLRERGIEAEATRQATRGAVRRFPALWDVKAGQEGRLIKAYQPNRPEGRPQDARHAAQAAWREIATALGGSGRSAVCCQQSPVKRVLVHKEVAMARFEPLANSVLKVVSWVQINCCCLARGTRWPPQ